jgi:plasmid stability protein
LSAQVDCIAIIDYNDCSAIIEAPMASITIRNLDDDLKKRLRIRAAEHGRSMEDEARQILRDRLYEKSGSGADILRQIRAIVEPIGGIEIELPPRESIPDPPDFSSSEFNNEKDE